MTAPDPLVAPVTLENDLVTVVIPARNEESSIEPCLRSILAQTYQPLEVFVIDGVSTDATAEVVAGIADRDPRVHLLENPDRTIPAALNIGLRAAKGRWLVRVDAHASVPPQYVSRAVRHLRSGSWGGVGGRKDGIGITPAGRAIAACMGSRFGVGNSTYHYGVEQTTVEHVPFGSYPVDVVRKLGGWNPALRVNQDFEFDYRLRLNGYDILFDPAMRIDWECRQSVPDLFRQYFRYGRGKLTVMRLHPKSTRLRHLLAPALIGSWLLGILAMPIDWRISAALFAPYVVALLAASLMTAGRVEGLRAKLSVPLVFVAMHSGWGFGWWSAILGGLKASRSPQPRLESAGP